MNPFEKFYRVPTSQELLDIAFSRAMKSSAQVSISAPRMIKAERKEKKRIQVVIKELITRILVIIKSVPMLDEIPEFYRELAALLVDTEKLKLVLGRLNGILPVLSKLERDYLKAIKDSELPKEIAKHRKGLFGRVSSIIMKQKSSLEYLNEIRHELRKIPSINYTLPSIVIAGYPNVGKSSIVKLVSSAKPEIQPYPFTTKNINIGHYVEKLEYDEMKFQIIDTPGILDRPMSKRNNIELQAILALRLVSDFIIYVFDPTLACGYSIESQIELYNEVILNFSKEGRIPVLIVFNKIDLAKETEIKYLQNKLNLENEIFFLINALTGENVDSLIKYVVKELK